MVSLDPVHTLPRRFSISMGAMVFSPGSEPSIIFSMDLVHILTWRLPVIVQLIALSHRRTTIRTLNNLLHGSGVNLRSMVTNNRAINSYEGGVRSRVHFFMDLLHNLLRYLLKVMAAVPMLLWELTSLLVCHCAFNNQLHETN